MNPLILIALAACLSTLPAVAQSPRLQPAPVKPSAIVQKPGLYLGRPVPVRGYPQVKQQPGTGTWKGTTGGVKIEMTPAAKAAYDKAKPTGTAPRFTATLQRRGGSHVLIYDTARP